MVMQKKHLKYKCFVYSDLNCEKKKSETVLQENLEEIPKKKETEGLFKLISGEISGEINEHTYIRVVM